MQKGKWNLSKVPCPPCFKNIGFISPPECYNELNRRKAVEKYMNLPHWNEKQMFSEMIKSIRKTFKVSGIAISLIDKNRTIIKYETTLDMSEIPRIASIDAHTILSKEYFLLLDASKDWRTSTNPFVKGVPYIKFYLGVSLVDENNNSIGVLSIFDAFAKTEFLEEEKNCGKLNDYAKEVMKILTTPHEEIVEKIALKIKEKQKKLKVPQINSELAELSIKLGRATSRGTLMTVFEKDGSGNAYSQNHNFRFSKFLKEEETKDEVDINFEKKKIEIFNKLFKVGSLKNASSILTKSISINFNIDFVYILEIRICESFLISNEYFPQNLNKIDAENFKYANKLIKVGGGSNNKSKNDKHDESIDLMTRIIGIHGSKYQLLNFENSIHYKSFLSEFGIYYEDPLNNSIYNKGVIMPFYRYNSKLIRKNSKAKTDSKKKIEVYLRSGGYLIGLFNQSMSKNSFDANLISKIFDHTSILKKIYITNK